MDTTRLRALLFPSLLALAVAGCAPASSGSPGPSLPGSSPTDAVPSDGGVTFPLTLTDDAGRSVTIPADPERIVSLAPSNTEIACALDACEQLVGVTDYDDYPAMTADLPEVVIAAQVDVEKVVAADPQLILAAGNELTSSSVITQLADLGYPVLVLYPEDLDELYADITLVGRALDAEAAADDLLTDMRARAQAVVEAVAGAERPRTFYEVGLFEGTIYTAGEGSFLASLISLAGGEPVTGDPLSTSLQLEDLVAADPELILLGDAAYDRSVTAASVAARPGWDGLAAVQSGQIVPILDDLVVTRPGPRIVDGLEALASAIHPERFE
ncbi:MAG: ABC transporter substrate-binding protein [Chloroflexota bacterium]